MPRLGTLPRKWSRRFLEARPTIRLRASCAKFPAAPPRSGVGSKIPGTGVPEWSQAANSRKRKGRNRENPNGKPSGSEHFSNGILRASLSSAGRVPEAKAPSCIEVPRPGSGLFPANGTAALRSGCRAGGRGGQNSGSGTLGSSLSGRLRGAPIREFWRSRFRAAKGGVGARRSGVSCSWPGHPNSRKRGFPKRKSPILLSENPELRSGTPFPRFPMRTPRAPTALKPPKTFTEPPLTAQQGASEPPSPKLHFPKKMRLVAKASLKNGTRLCLQQWPWGTRLAGFTRPVSLWCSDLAAFPARIRFSEFARSALAGTSRLAAVRSCFHASRAPFAALPWPVRLSF